MKPLLCMPLDDTWSLALVKLHNDRIQHVVIFFVLQRNHCNLVMISYIFTLPLYQLSELSVVLICCYITLQAGNDKCSICLRTEGTS